MTLVITKQPRRARYASDSQRAQASMAGRLAEGHKRKIFFVPPDVEEKAQQLMKQHDVGFADLVRSLIRSA